MLVYWRVSLWIAVLWLFDYPNLVGYQGIGVAGTNRATVWAELLSSGYSTATRINTMGDVTGCQDEENDWRMSMFSSLSGSLHQNDLNRFWLSSLHFPGNFHPSTGFFRSFRVEIGEMFTLMQLQLLGHCTMLGLRANSFWPSTVSYPIPVTWCCVVTVVVV